MGFVFSCHSHHSRHSESGNGFLNFHLADVIIGAIVVQKKWPKLWSVPRSAYILAQHGTMVGRYTSPLAVTEKYIGAPGVRSYDVTSCPKTSKSTFSSQVFTYKDPSAHHQTSFPIQHSYRTTVTQIFVIQTRTWIRATPRGYLVERIQGFPCMALGNQITIFGNAYWVRISEKYFGRSQKYIQGSPL